MPREKILIVNDDPSACKLFYIMLTRGGYPAVSVSGGQEALDFLAADPRDLPDLILLDVRMPPPDGYDVLRALRRQTRWRTISVVLTATFPAEADWAALGAQGWLELPLLHYNLLRCVREVLDLRRMIH